MLSGTKGENTRNILAWRHASDIKSGSTLIVNPGQCNIISNGKELARFNAGKHRLKSLTHSYWMNLKPLSVVVFYRIIKSYGL